MPNVKLSDAELANRVRARTKRASAKYRERKTLSGRTQTLVWLPDTIRAQLDTLVEERNESLSAVTTALLSSALATPRLSTRVDFLPTAPAIADTLDMFGAPVNTNSSSHLQTEPANWQRDANSTPRPKLTQAERDERDRAIVELHRQGLSNPKIGERFNTSEGSIRRALDRVKKNASQTDSII